MNSTSRYFPKDIDNMAQSAQYAQSTNYTQNQILSKQFSNNQCNGLVQYNEITKNITISGKLNNFTSDTKLYYWASSPPTIGMSFSGSGMPYPNPIVAYDKTPNKGQIKLDNSGSFSIDMKYPNAYYIGLGSLYVAPHVNFKIQNGCNETYFTLPIDDGIPFRTLTYTAPPSKNSRDSAMFYCVQEHEARSQESILRASAYPKTNNMPDNFWGDRPPR